MLSAAVGIFDHCLSNNEKAELQRSHSEVTAESLPACWRPSNRKNRTLCSSPKNELSAFSFNLHQSPWIPCVYKGFARWRLLSEPSPNLHLSTILIIGYKVNTRGSHGEGWVKVFSTTFTLGNLDKHRAFAPKGEGWRIFNEMALFCHSPLFLMRYLMRHLMRHFHI